jgi:hypothetical protein
VLTGAGDAAYDGPAERQTRDPIRVKAPERTQGRERQRAEPGAGVFFIALVIDVL